MERRGVDQPDRKVGKERNLEGYQARTYDGGDEKRQEQNRGICEKTLWGHGWQNEIKIWLRSNRICTYERNPAKEDREQKSKS